MMSTSIRATKRGVLAGLCVGTLATAGCADGRQVPTSPTVSVPGSLASTASDEDHLTTTASPRSGDLHITKECSEYSGQPGAFCTFTASNLDSLPVGTRVVYSSAPGPTGLDSDVLLDPPGPGNNTAFGHCRLVFATGLGLCSFSGGTGKFTHFQARVDVSSLGGPDFGWDGTFSFAPRD